MRHYGADLPRPLSLTFMMVLCQRELVAQEQDETHDPSYKQKKIRPIPSLTNHHYPHPISVVNTRPTSENEVSAIPRQDERRKPIPSNPFSNFDPPHAHSRQSPYRTSGSPPRPTKKQNTNQDTFKLQWVPHIALVNKLKEISHLGHTFSLSIPDLTQAFPVSRDKQEHTKPHPIAIAIGGAAFF